MIPRNELMNLLREKLQDRLPQDQVERLAGEILALEGGWEEVDVAHQDLGYSHSDLCSSICWLASETEEGRPIKLFRKKKQ